MFPGFSDLKALQSSFDLSDQCLSQRGLQVAASGLLAAVAASAAVSGFVSRARAWSSCDENKLADSWRERLGPGAKLLDRGRHEESLRQREDKHFISQTCTGPRLLADCKVFQCEPVDHRTAHSEAVDGKTRICCVFKVGNELNGHPGLLHGGFLAALIDDFTGMAAWLEKKAQGFSQHARIFTANLNVNYRRPLPHDSEYFLDVYVVRVEKHKKIFLQATIYDGDGNTCTESSALYIVKQ